MKLTAIQITYGKLLKPAYPGDIPGWEIKSKNVIGELEVSDSFGLEDAEEAVKKRFPLANWFQAHISSGFWFCSGSL